MNNTAQAVLENRRTSSHVLTTEFARRVNKVGRLLGDEVTCRDLFWIDAGPAWEKLYQSLEAVEKSCLSRALSGSYSRYTVGDIRSSTVDGLVGWKVGPVTAAFLILAFQKS